MPNQLLYSGKFWNGANFCIFRMKPGDAKISNVQILETSNFEWAILTHGSGDQAMAL